MADLKADPTLRAFVATDLILGEADPIMSEADPAMSEADPTMSRAELQVTLKEGTYRISRHILRGSTFYLTRQGMDVEASLLNEKTNAHIWNVKPHIEVLGIYTITSFEDPDLFLTYDTSNIVVDGILQNWALDVRGSQFVIGDFANEKAINLGKNSELSMQPRSDSMILSDHSQRWTFTIAKSINNRWDDDEDLPHGLEDWRDTTLECGIYFVMNETDNWFQWGQSMTTIAPLTSYYPMAGIPQSDNTNYFVASAFVFARNDDGSYYISNWFDLAKKSHERFLQVSNGGPVLAQARSKCHLYRNKYNGTYVIAISDSGSRDPIPRAIVFNPPTKDRETILGIKTLHDVSTGGVHWRISKVAPS